MSALDDWMIAYYPVSARTVKNVRKAIHHGIKKYEGYKAAQRDPQLRCIEHKIVDVVTGNKFFFSQLTCALCNIYWGYDDADCSDACPLAQIGEKCTEHNSAYEQFCNKSDPAPMLEALKRARSWWNIQSKKEGKPWA